MVTDAGNFIGHANRASTANSKGICIAEISLLRQLALLLLFLLTQSTK
jgi:hypothetical protein